MLFLNVTQAIQTAATQPNYPAIAGLIALAITLAKIISVLIDLVKNKYAEEKAATVKLDDETLKIFKGVKEDVEKVNEKIEEHLIEENNTLNTLRDISINLKEVSHSQEKLYTKFEKDIEKLNDKFEKDIDKLYVKIDRINVVGIK